jgi:hypothetical protein
MNLKVFVENSGLPKEDKEFWSLLLSKIDGEQLETFEDFVQGNEENLKILTENIKSKKKAFESLDEKALDKIIQNEQ